MNIEYLRFFDIVVVADQDRNLTDRPYTENIEEVLRQENIVEIIKDTINLDNSSVNQYTNIIKKKEIIIRSSLTISSLLIPVILICNAISLDISLIISSVCLGASCLSIVIEKNNIKRFKRKISDLKYKLLVSNAELDKQKTKLRELKADRSEKQKRIVYNNFIYTIDDEQTLSSITRKLELAHLYKMKEEIIEKKLEEDNINNYLSTLKLQGKKLTEEDKKELLRHVKVLKKQESES